MRRAVRKGSPQSFVGEWRTGRPAKAFQGRRDRCHRRCRGGRHHRRNRGPPGAGAAIGGALGLGAGAVIGDYMQGQEQQQYQTNQQQIQQSQRAIERNSYQIQKARQTEY